MDGVSYLVLIMSLGWANFVIGIKFSAESFAEISLLAKEGKFRLESLSEKAKVPQFGSCWKNAISDLQIGCKFLSENVQSDLALRFTDCFLQMSGHDPLVCDFPKSACLQKLSDRAFNAYTEFYTHTQSICYFLQSQLWHEETEKTIDRLATTSMHVSQKLEEAEKIQETLLRQQKESLSLQHSLNDNSKNVVSTLQSSQDKINTVIKDFQSSATEQKKLLLELFDYLVSFKSWAADELSWFSSTVFFVTATVISFLFTSVSRTRGARMFIFIVFAFNYLFERFLSSISLGENIFVNKSTILADSLQSWIWFCRKFCIFLSVIIIVYMAVTYYDYNVMNYQLLLEIKNQNQQILNYFSPAMSNQKKISNNFFSHKSDAFNNSLDNNLKSRYKSSLYSKHDSNQSHYQTFNSPALYSDVTPNRNFDFLPHDCVDSEENKKPDNANNVSVTSEIKNNTELKCTYNLRSKISV